MTRMTKRAIKRAGGPKRLAEALKLTRQAVVKWPHVPAKHVLKVEELSGVSRYDLRPDVYGPKPIRPESDQMAAA